MNADASPPNQPRPNAPAALGRRIPAHRDSPRAVSSLSEGPAGPRPEGPKLQARLDVESRVGLLSVIDIIAPLLAWAGLAFIIPLAHGAHGAATTSSSRA